MASAPCFFQNATPAPGNDRQLPKLNVAGSIPLPAAQLTLSRRMRVRTRTGVARGAGAVADEVPGSETGRFSPGQPSYTHGRSP